MHAFTVLSLLIPFALAADQGKGCDINGGVTVDCSGDNVVECYTWAGRDSPTWNFTSNGNHL
ncbi:hypothetical protein CI238_03557 [Colletotrichum incanum]|uniref:Uncharacterized protein n=1 Tax=Colletotrichum incanum TaxID=1573173 RepID=A0A167DXA8_COLIC|nr:hypothetical protein CI238_03557 [Colletotrichum incanum]